MLWFQENSSTSFKFQPSQLTYKWFPLKRILYNFYIRVTFCCLRLHPEQQQYVQPARSLCLKHTFALTNYLEWLMVQNSTCVSVFMCVFVVSVWTCCGGCRGRRAVKNQSIRKGTGLSVLSPQSSTLQDTVEHVIGMITPNTYPCPHHIPLHSPANCPFDPDLPPTPSYRLLPPAFLCFLSFLATLVGSCSTL